MGDFWEAEIFDFRTFFNYFSKQILKSVLEGPKIEKNWKKESPPEILGRPGGMCGARGRDREGVIRRSRPKLFKLGKLGLIDFGKDFDLKSSTRRHLRWGGGFKRFARSAGPYLGGQ